MTSRHLDDLFSAAYEHELSPAEEARFDAHIQACEPCSAAYEEFKAGIAALRELPQARMPHAVHLPSTSPVAERPSRPPIGLSWFNLGLLRRFPATAVAGAVALVLVILALTRVGAGSTLGADSNPNLTLPNAAIGTVPEVTPVAEAACSGPTTTTGSTPPLSYSALTQASDPAEPALHVVLAAPTRVVAPGATVSVYAQLSVPVAAAVNPSESLVTNPPPRALLPCVQVGVADTKQQLTVSRPSSGLPEAAPGTGPTVGAAPGYQVAGAGPLYTFTIPTGLAAGTEVDVTATVPAGFAAAGSPQLNAELILTIG